MPPLRGIIHAAMLLDDGVLLRLDGRRFRKVTAPKMDGAWNLHKLTLNPVTLLRQLHRAQAVLWQLSVGMAVCEQPAQAVS